MAARSVTVIFQNYTDSALTFKSAELQHGIWSENMYPPTRIPARTTESPGTGAWESESSGFMTGTEGTAVYYIDDGQRATTVEVHWDNPWATGNEYSIDPEGPRKNFYRGIYTGGGGDNATVTFGLQNMNEAAPSQA